MRHAERRTIAYAVAMTAFAAATALLADRAAATTANDLCLGTANPCVVASPVAVSDGSVIDLGTRELRINSGGSLNVASGEMTITAGSLTVNAGGSLLAAGTASTKGGRITATAGTITVAGTINADGGPGQTTFCVSAGGGTVRLTSTGSVTLSGTISAEALSSLDCSGGTVILIAATTMNVTGPISARGKDNGVGGEVTLSASGDITVSSTIDVSGGDAGDISVDAGDSTGAGNLTILASAELIANGTVAAGSGGGVDCSARGDGVSTGRIVMKGRARSNGQLGTIESGGGDGEGISFTADGNIDLLVDPGDTTTGVQSIAGYPDGMAGDIEVTSIGGSLVSAQRIDMSASGPEAAAGSLDIEVHGDAAINASIDGQGGGDAGADILVQSDIGSITVAAGTTIDAGCADGAGGFGGEIDLLAGFTPGTTGAKLLVNGTLNAKGTGNLEYGGGSGGILVLSAPDEVRVTAQMNADGGAFGGGGGSIALTSKHGPVKIEAAASADGGSGGGPGGVIMATAEDGTVAVSAQLSAVGATSSGGNITLTGSKGVTVNGILDVHAVSDGPGGHIVIASDIPAMGPVVIEKAAQLGATIRAAGNGSGIGGRVEVASGGDVTIRGSVDNVGGGSSAGGGTTTLSGCNVSVASTATLQSGQTGGAPGKGTNVITARDAATIAGDLLAGATAATDAHNRIFYRNTAPVITGTVKPAAEITKDTSIPPCGVIAPTATNTATITPTATPTATGGTATPTATQSQTGPTVTFTRLPTRTPPPPTATPTGTPPTVTPAPCAGDCNDDDTVTVDEVLRAIGVALGTLPGSACSRFDLDGNGSVTIDELVRIVRAALNTCGA